MKKRKYVSDYLNVETIKNLINDIPHLIAAGVGRGKTTFVQNVIVPYCEENNKTMLFITPRILIADKMKSELNIIPGIDVHTTQSIENHLNNLKKVGNYDFIIIDEAHLLIEDSDFNMYTDILYDWLINQQNSIKILMTGTPEHLKKCNLIGKLNILLELEAQDNISKFTFLQNDAQFFSKLNAAYNNKEKTIVFCSSATTAYELHKRYEKSAFLCSETNKSVAKYRTKSAYNSIIEDENFKETILFITTVGTTGISINDNEIKKVFMYGIFNDIEFKQAVARVREKSSPDIEVIIKTPDPKKLEARYRQICDELTYVNNKEVYSEGHIRKKVPRFICIQNCKETWNKFIPYKLLYFKEFIERVKEYGYEEVTMELYSYKIESNYKPLQHKINSLEYKLQTFLGNKKEIILTEEVLDKFKDYIFFELGIRTPKKLDEFIKYNKSKFKDGRQKNYMFHIESKIKSEHGEKLRGWLISKVYDTNF